MAWKCTAEGSKVAVTVCYSLKENTNIYATEEFENIDRSCSVPLSVLCLLVASVLALYADV